MSSLSKLRSWLLRLKPPYRGVEGGVEVAHVVEQADLVGGVGVVGRRLGAGDRGAGLKENLRRLRRFGGLRWLYRWFLACLVELAWPAAWSVFLRAGLDVWDPITSSTCFLLVE